MSSLIFLLCLRQPKDGTATLDLDDGPQDMKPLLETMIHNVLPPVADPAEPFQSIEYYVRLRFLYRPDFYRSGIHGQVKVSETIALVKRNGDVKRGRVTKNSQIPGSPAY